MNFAFFSIWNTFYCDISLGRKDVLDRLCLSPRA